MPIVPNEDKASTVEGFAEILVDADARVFQSKEHVMGFFKSVDEIFGDENLKFGDPCTFPATFSCWAVNRQERLNAMFMPRGVELLQLDKGTLCFRTMDVDPDEFVLGEDVKFLCLFLWFLRQHSCISSVRISISVLAHRHVSLFASLLILTERVRKCEISGDHTFVGPPPERPQLNALALDDFSKLRKLALAAFHVSDDEASMLACVIERNDPLTALALIDVEMSAAAFASVAFRVSEHRDLQDFRVKMAAVEPEARFNEALGLIGKSQSITRLHVHLAHGLLELLRGLLDNSSLRELTSETMIKDAHVFGALVDFLEKQQSFRRLKVLIDGKKLASTASGLDKMQRMVGKSSLEVLVLSGSVLDRKSVGALTAGLAVSKTLKELHVDNCKLSFTEVLLFVPSIKKCLKHGRFKQLNVGTVIGDDGKLCEMCNTITQADICGQITLTYTDAFLASMREVLTTTPNFSDVTVCCFGESLQVEPALHALTANAGTMKTLSITIREKTSLLGSQFLINLILASVSLRVLRLNCPLRTTVMVRLIKTIGASTTLVVVAFERWVFGEAEGRALVDALRENHSLQRLEFYFESADEYKDLEPHLVKGLSCNTTVSSVKVYAGEKREQVIVHEFELLKYLRWNAMTLSWTLALVIHDRRPEEAAAALDILDFRDDPLDVFRRAGDFPPPASEHMLRSVRMKTRTMYHALHAEYAGNPEFRYNSEGRSVFKNLMWSFHDDVLEAMGFPQNYSSSASSNDEP